MPRLAALAIAMAGDPQEVCGADTCGLSLHTEIKSGHVTSGRLRRDQPSGKKARNPLLGVVCLLTTGGLIRVRLGCLVGLWVGAPCLAHPRAPAPPYWITSSAWKRSVGGIVIPRALAVLRLMTSSNFMGCSTGRSAGFAPFRILST